LLPSTSSLPLLLVTSIEQLVDINNEWI
jgi:hypothetical protein